MARTKGAKDKQTLDVKELAKDYTAEAVEALASIMRASESDAARVTAIKELLDRGHGKPKQSIDAEVSATVTELRRTVHDPRHPNG